MKNVIHPLHIKNWGEERKIQRSLASLIVTVEDVTDNTSNVLLLLFPICSH